MSLGKNVLASYVSQIYVTLIGILMVPMYVRYMGVEAYGLVGFFAMMQAWFQLLDMGLTPTMSRETARFNGGASDALSLRRLFRLLESIFVGTALLGALAIFAGSGEIARNWLKVQHLPVDEVAQAIALMGVSIALRWACGLYRGTVTGFEQLVWLSGFNVAMATARFVLVIPFFILVGASPTEFFLYQAAVAVIELLVLVLKAYRLLPALPAGGRGPWHWAPLRAVLKFSLSVAFTGSVWVFVTQTDKLVLSKLLPLSDYAFFTLAVLVASGVSVISGPISGALLPRMTRLAAEGDDAQLVRLYRHATQFVGLISIPVSLVLAFFAEQVLWAWTGNAALAANAAPVLTLYALGNGILALSAFPYYLQFAKGDLRLHLIGNALFLVLLIPSLVWATIRFGVVGAGFAWLAANAVYFLAWVPRVHMRFVPGLHSTWLRDDVAAIAAATIVASACAHQFIAWPADRMSVALVLFALSAAVLLVAAAASSSLRQMFASKLASRRANLLVKEPL